MGKVFVGAWISKDTRVRLKVACAILNVNQEDVIDLLILKWLNSPHVKEEIKQMKDGKE